MTRKGIVSLIKVWTNEYLLTLSESDFKAIMGLSKDCWRVYCNFHELHGFCEYWGNREMPWDTALALTQVKLAYIYISSMFFYMYKYV